MAYQKGEVEIANPEWDGDYDARGDYRHDPYAYLPHSCDRWVIGGPAEIEAMIADLTAALKILRDGAA